jgi:ankyrin repeat protein
MAGFPAILRAAADGNVHILSAILDSGVPVSTANGIGQTALHLAAMWGHTDAVELLLNADAEVNLQNQFGVTPLHYAAQKSHYDVAHLLLVHGANTKVRSMKGHLPHEVAEDDEMRTLCGAPSLELHAAVKKYDLPTLHQLVSGGADLSEADNKGRTALHLVVAAFQAPSQKGRDNAMEMLNALLAADGDAAKDELAQALIMRSEDGLTPLHLAASQGSSKLLEALLNVVPSVDGDPYLQALLDLKSFKGGQLCARRAFTPRPR